MGDSDTPWSRTGCPHGVDEAGGVGGERLDFVTRGPLWGEDPLWGADRVTRGAHQQPGGGQGSEEMGDLVVVASTVDLVGKNDPGEHGALLPVVLWSAVVGLENNLNCAPVKGRALCGCLGASVWWLSNGLALLLSDREDSKAKLSLGGFSLGCPGGEVRGRTTGALRLPCALRGPS